MISNFTVSTFGRRLFIWLSLGPIHPDADLIFLQGRNKETRLFTIDHFDTRTNLPVKIYAAVSFHVGPRKDISKQHSNANSEDTDHRH